MSKIVDFDGATYSSFSEGREAVRFTAAGCEFVSHPDVDSMFDGDYGCRPDFYIQGVIVDYKGAIYQDNFPRLIELSRRAHRIFVATGDMPFNCYTLEEYVGSIIETWERIGSCGYHTYNAWDNGNDRGMVVPVFTKAGKVKYVMGAPQDVDRVCEWLREHFSEEDLDFTLELARYASGFRNFDYEEDWADEGTVEYKDQMNRIHTDTLHSRNDQLTIYSTENDINEISKTPVSNDETNDIEDEWDKLADELEDVEVETGFEPEAEVDPDEYVELESDPELDPNFVPEPGFELEPEWFEWVREVGIKVGKSHGRGNVITRTVGNRLYEKLEHNYDKFMEVITLLMESNLPLEKRFKRVYVEEVGAVVCAYFGKYDDRARMIKKISSLSEEDVDKSNYGKVLCDRYDYRKHYNRLSDNLECVKEQRFSEVAQDLSLRTGVPVGNVAAILGDSIALGYVSLNLA